MIKKKIIIESISIICFLMLLLSIASASQQNMSEKPLVDAQLGNDKEKKGICYSRLQNQTDIPTWTVGDNWVYEADIFSDTENGLFDIFSDNLMLTIENLTSVVHENTSVDVYIVNISGNVSGSFESSLLSGDVNGSIDGCIIIRQADLSLLHTNISSFGIVEWFLLDLDYETASVSTYYPSFEYFDFPLIPGETWNTSSTVYQNSSFYVQMFYDNTTESTEQMNGYAECLDIENITVPAGTFSSYHILSEGNETIESWYNSTVKNMVKLFVNQNNETSTTTIYMNLTSYNLHNQPIDVSVDISPAIVDVDSSVTISGSVVTNDTGQPIPNANVSILIPYTGQEYTLTTDTLGSYSLTIIAPLLLDPTNTSYDIGSDGIIVNATNSFSSGYNVATLTVTGIAVANVEAIPDIQYETNTVNITCTIYSVENITHRIVNISGPAGFTPLNVTLNPAGNDRYYYFQPYPIIGSYSFYIWAEDTIGNTNKSLIHDFTIIPDTIPPIIQNIDAQPNPQYANNSVNITCQVTDNVDVATVKVNITNPLDDVVNASMVKDETNYFYHMDYTILGNYSYYIWTNDTLGNTNKSSTFNFSIVSDTTPPLIDDNTSTVGYIGHDFTFNATITDNAEVSTAWVEYWFGTGAPNNESMAPMANNRWIKTITIPDTLDTLYYTIAANDTSDNWNNTDVENVSILEYESEDVNQSVFDRGFPIRHAVDGDWAGAQSFTPTVDSLTRAELYLRKFGTPEFDLTVELREDSPTGTLLDTVVFTPSEVSSSWGWLNVNFTDVTVTPGTDCFIVLPPAPSGVTTSFGYEWGYAFGNQYDPGSFWFTRDGGGLWRDLPTMYEFTFRTYGYG